MSKFRAYFCATVNWILAGFVISIQFLLSSGKEIFDFKYFSLTAGELWFIAHMLCLAVLVNMIIHYYPSIKIFIERWFKP